MPETVEFDFNKVVSNWLNKRHPELGETTVTKVEQIENTGGYCSTCWFCETYVKITYLDSEEREQEFDLDDGKYMSDFIKELALDNAIY